MPMIDTLTTFVNSGALSKNSPPSLKHDEGVSGFAFEPSKSAHVDSALQLMREAFRPATN